jgi:ABC-type phosphate/phosphonate transport system substrate-binding protein
MTIATLQMYDLPEVRVANDDWWAGLARALRRAGLSEVPAQLTWDGPPEGPWRDPGFLFGQTCGYPLMHGLAGVVQVVATPVYTAPGCEGPHYRSIFVVREDEAARSLAELRGRIAAFNSTQSQSGYSALRSAVAPLARDGSFFSQVIETGGHIQSARAVAEGRADLAALDCVTYALLARHCPAAVAGLRVLDRSAAAPGLPYVTRADAPADLVARLRDGLAEAAADPALAAAREALLLTGVEVLAPKAYDRILQMEAEAQTHGYPRLA